ncbi:uncharacterized protein N7496_003299 [Penicillium cataractarum]|uniref:Aminoglycoside phosphotransferase domain-containing protein n=1 Tax=Penicillium cataractarum TaxID=2100454 RepID=A0A9W9SLR1_9EURO|nr:uncharacterized protein N7496_003299 [Penicillium cataractarum]KAJ5380871.1 hypothetical protein N7496_003299 [Penicillium cataractarum]
MVLLHKDFGVCNVMVVDEDNHLIRYDNYDALDKIFWDVLSTHAVRFDGETVRTINAAMVVDLLLSHGFTSRPANMPIPEPIRDESGAYEMLGLDCLLINPATRLVYE